LLKKIFLPVVQQTRTTVFAVALRAE